TRPINFAVLKARCRFGLRVSEAEVAAAQRFAFSHLRLVLEPGGAAALAAAIAGKVAVDGRTAIVASGGNVDADRFARVLAGPEPGRAGRPARAAHSPLPRKREARPDRDGNPVAGGGAGRRKSKGRRLAPTASLSSVW